jgi:hypothetical protein
MIGIAPGMSVRGRHVAARSLGDHMHLASLPTDIEAAWQLESRLV